MIEAPFLNVRVTVLDGVGAGPATTRNAEYPQDMDVVNSLVNASRVAPLRVPALLSMGLRRISGLENIVTAGKKEQNVKGAYGSLNPTFAGNGSPEGHQALMGHIVTEPYLLFNETGFPPEIVELAQNTVSTVLGRPVEIIRYQGTDDVNGVQFINTPGIGDAHVESAQNPQNPLKIPLYASTDSLLQFALHQDIVPQAQQEEIGKAVRAALDQKGYRVARVIMRPFEDDPDKPSKFRRVSADRRDYVVEPDKPTLIDYIATKTDVTIHASGKAASMFGNHGFDLSNIHKLGSDKERMEAIVENYRRRLVGANFSIDNLVGTDELFGHTRNPAGYVEHLAMIDPYIGEAMQAMQNTDLWIITSDHGNDPTQIRHTNHTNEYVPVLVYSPRMRRPMYLGVRQSYADVAKTVAANYGIADSIEHGKSFLPQVLAA